MNELIKTITYRPTRTGEMFHKSSAFVRGIKGPVGSGKTVMCVIELLKAACRQTPHTDGVRYSRTFVFRNTYDQLKNTTIKTWLNWVPEDIGDSEFRRSVPITHHLKFNLADGTRVDNEVIFVSLDEVRDVGKLKSLEATFIWVNEASEIPNVFYDVLKGRVRRYPNDEQHGKYSDSFIIFDTNPPAADPKNWVYRLMEVEKPLKHEFFHQPPAIIKNEDGEWVGNPDAENVENHIAGYNYWLDQVHGAEPEYIRVMLEGRYGLIKAGLPVYDKLFVEEHISKQEDLPTPGLPVLMGWDWGLYPAIIFGQLLPTGKLKILKELAPDEQTSLEELVQDILPPFKEQYFKGFRFHGWGDPAGLGKSPMDKRTPFTVVREAGYLINPTLTNDFIPRRDAVVKFLNRRNGFEINPSCTKLISGFRANYFYKEIQGLGLYKERPEKNNFSHPHDGLQYLCLGINSPYDKPLPKGRKTGVAA